MGKKRQPIYKLVAADSRSPRDGKFIEAIGLYNPKTDPATIDIQESRALYWLGVGAQPTLTVKNLLSSQGIILKKELIKKGVKEEEVVAKVEEFKQMKATNLAAKMKKKADSKKSKKALAKEKSQSASEA